MADLTDREQEVLNLIATGIASNNDLAARLGISPNTVKNHKSHMLRKMGLTGQDSLAAVVKAAREGLIDMQFPEAQPDLLAIADVLQEIAWRLRAFAEEVR